MDMINLGEATYWFQLFLLIVNSAGIIGTVAALKRLLPIESDKAQKVSAAIVALVWTVLTLGATGELNADVISSGELPVFLASAWGVAVAAYHNIVKGSEPDPL